MKYSEVVDQIEKLKTALPDLKIAGSRCIPCSPEVEKLTGFKSVTMTYEDARQEIENLENILKEIQ